MSGRVRFTIGGVVIGLILLYFFGWEIALLVIALAIAIPVAGYLMLDPSQRRRLRRIRQRRQIGS